MSHDSKSQWLPPNAHLKQRSIWIWEWAHYKYMLTLLTCSKRRPWKNVIKWKLGKEKERNNVTCERKNHSSSCDDVKNLQQLLCRALEPCYLLLFYIQFFWISSSKVLNAALQLVLRDSPQSTWCIILNSWGLAFLNSPPSTSCTSSAGEPVSTLDSSCSHLVKSTPNTFGVFSGTPFGGKEGGLSLPLPVTVFRCWFTFDDQYSRHWWGGSRASIACAQPISIETYHNAIWHGLNKTTYKK